ncbi:MAG: nuclear transport factor 2 family protein [Lawsonibacter sp.]
MEHTTQKHREEKVRTWFAMWLQKQDSGLQELFSHDAVYIESWGPEYHGNQAIKLWFDEWNTRGTVLLWEIKQFFHRENQSVVEWTFRCTMQDGTVQSFDGLSLLRWTPENQICFLQEFGCNSARYNPYAQGEKPIFRDEPSLWF